MNPLLEKSKNIRVLILVTVLAVLGIFIFREVLGSLIRGVLHREDASHGLCVPFISGYLIWLKSEKIRVAIPNFAPVPGALMVGAGFLLFFLMENSVEPTFTAFSFFLVAAGLVVGLFGNEVFKEVRFPIFFLITMIPLPDSLYAQLTEWMRMVTTTGSVGVLQLLHFPIYREGYYISIPNMNLFIGGSCSGIRYLIPYFVFGLAYAFVCKKTTKIRMLVVLATIPISIIGGVLRQDLIFISAYYIGPFVTEHRPHVLLSWAVFLAVLMGAMWLDRGLTRWAERPGC